MNILGLAKHRIEKSHNPQGFNIGTNDGPVAGQTISHLHIHLIPRHHSDVENLKGVAAGFFQKARCIENDAN